MQLTYYYYALVLLFSQTPQNQLQMLTKGILNLNITSFRASHKKSPAIAGLPSFFSHLNTHSSHLLLLAAIPTIAGICPGACRQYKISNNSLRAARRNGFCLRNKTERTHC